MNGTGFMLQHVVILLMERLQKKTSKGNLAQWIIAQPKGFTENDIEKVSRSLQLYIYLDLIYQVQTMSSIVGSSVSTVAARCFH